MDKIAEAGKRKAHPICTSLKGFANAGKALEGYDLFPAGFSDFVSICKPMLNGIRALLYIGVFTGTFYTDCFSQSSRDALSNYIHARDTSFSWRDYQVSKTADAVFYEMNMVSQTWHNIIWKHRLMIYIPAKATHPDNLLLALRHIYHRNEGLASLKIISDSTGTSSAILYDLPNQPLFEREEDDLQAYTFSQYIRSGDESWPLLFPMVKSVVRGMDAIQQLARKESGLDINTFVIAGHSKRGHTAWLSASVDARIKGVIPIAIDVLNGSAQLSHHLEAFGAYNTPSKEATEFLQELVLPRGKELMKMIDPYSYREQLTLPKLIVLAVNDDYFPTDALNFYWEGLKGPKWILYLSNASHVRADSDPRINHTAFAFVRAIAANDRLPNLTWKVKPSKESLQLHIEADASALNAVVWVTSSPTKDFRQTQWSAAKMKQHATDKTAKRKNTTYFETNVKKPLSGFTIFYGEIEFMQDGHLFLLCTQTYLSSGK